MSSLSEMRRKSRERAFIILFEKSFNEDMSVEEIIDFAIDSEVIEPDEYMLELVNKAINNIDEVDAGFEKYLKGWSKSRISKVSLALLRMTVSEMLFSEGVPFGVSINEAIEICKIYGSDDDKTFVNGVLGSVARNLEG